MRRHLQAIDRTLAALESHRGRPAHALHDDDERWAVERGLQLCAQGVLDVATHVAAARGYETRDYASAIDALGDAGILSVPQVGRLRGLAGFRNVLVHAYLDVDLDVLHEILNHRLDDIRDFVVTMSHVLADGREP
jgi:uncharacterized protein YutE (UPF0331/DUF86 family)